MSGASNKAVGFWFCTIVCTACAGVVGGVAWYRGSINPAGWFRTSGPIATAKPVDQGYALVERTEPDLDAETFEAQSEPEDEPVADPNPSARANGRRKRHRAVDLPDDVDDRADASEIIETANFEETLEVPPASAAAESRGTGRTRDGVASARVRTNADQAAPGSDAADEGRGGPLMSLERIEALEMEGDLITAQHELSRWYWQKPAERERILPQLNRMARALFFSPQPHFYEPYVVQPGDQLRMIGLKHKLSWEYLARLNHVDARKIRAGQKLKVVPGPFGARVTLSRYELVIHLNGDFVKSYRVGVGKDGTTPVGTFPVKNKMLDPTYYGPEGVIAHDDPQNPLGERWVDIGDSYGIHGTIEPDSIGKSESRGCIRMLNSDVEEVYDFLVNGSEVRIQR